MYTIRSTMHALCFQRGGGKKSTYYDDGDRPTEQTACEGAK